MAKKVLHPALKANAERLKRGESIHKGGKRQSNVDKKSSTTTKTKAKSAVSKTSATQKPKIRSKKRG